MEESFIELSCINHKSADLLCCSEFCNDPAPLCLNNECGCISQAHPNCTFIHKDFFNKTMFLRKENLSTKDEKVFDNVV